MRLIILNIIFSIILISCSTNEPNQQINNLPDEALSSTILTFRKIPDDSLIHYAYMMTKSTKIINEKINFQTLDDFPNSWAGLSKNALGFFIYHRGLGLVDELVIENDTIRNGGYGESVSWPIREFKNVSDHKYYFGLGLDTTSGTYARCMIEILDLDTIYSLQSTQVYEMTQEGEKLLGQYSGLYIPIYKQHLFYHIDEPNRKDPNALIPTEEIDLEKFKKKKLITKATKKK